MRVLLQDKESGLYLSRGGNWTNNPGSALSFLDEVRARDFGIYHRLASAKVILWAEPGAPEIAPTTHASANNTNHNTQSHMITKEKTAPTVKRIQRKASKPARASATPAADQMIVVLEQPARPKPAPREVPHSQHGRPAEQATVVEAKIDVGLGNTVFIRGQGDGLSWLKGVPLNCVDAGTWVWSTTQAKDKVVFKLLLNDEVWARGEDVVAEAGRKIEIIPCF